MKKKNFRLKKQYRMHMAFFAICAMSILMISFYYVYRILTNINDNIEEQNNQYIQAQKKPETYRFYHSSKVLQRGSLFLSRQTILCYCLHECCQWHGSSK